MLLYNYLEKENIGDNAYIYTRDKILSMEFPPGCQLSEKKISDELQISKTPVREAFIKLAGEGLVHIKPYKGTFVTFIDVQIAEEARFIRENLESAVLRIACISDMSEFIAFSHRSIERQEECLKLKDYAGFVKHDDEYHQKLFYVCGKKLSWNVIREVSSQYSRLRVLYVANDENVMELIDEHRNFVEYIQQRDDSAAVKTLANHLKKIVLRTYKVMELHPEYFKQVL